MRFDHKHEKCFQIAFLESGLEVGASHGDVTEM